MQAIELETEVDENHEIHLKLPADVRVRKARVVVLYEESDTANSQNAPTQPLAVRSPRAFGQFRGQVWISDDFDTPLPDDFWLGGNP
jgi:hypothetical protein